MFQSSIERDKKHLSIIIILWPRQAFFFSIETNLSKHLRVKFPYHIHMKALFCDEIAKRYAPFQSMKAVQKHGLGSLLFVLV